MFVLRDVNAVQHDRFAESASRPKAIVERSLLRNPLPWVSLFGISFLFGQLGAFRGFECTRGEARAKAQASYLYVDITQAAMIILS
jgi:hypothetical protein